MHSDSVGEHRRDARWTLIARRILAGWILVASLVLSSGAGAKEFRPGDLSVCNAKRCVVIRNQHVLSGLAAFYYDPAKRPAKTRAPTLGTPFVGLEFSNGYVTGIVAGRSSSKFLSYGVNLDQFREGVWYRVPARAAAELRGLAAALTPLRLTDAALSGTTTFAIQNHRVTQPMRKAARPGTSPAQGDGPWLPLGPAMFAALIALALLIQRRRRPAASQPAPTPR